MKKEELFEIIGEIDGKLPEIRKSRPLWLKITGAAACIAAVTALTLGLMPKEERPSGMVNTLTSVTDMREEKENSEKRTQAYKNTVHEDIPADAQGQYYEAVDVYGLSDSAAQIFGGSYLDENGRYTVLLTKDSDENRRIICKEMEIDESGAVFKECAHSYAFLNEIHNKISEGMMNKTYGFVVGCGIMEMENCVEITVTSEDERLDEILALDKTGTAIKVVYGSTTNDLLHIEKK